MIKSNKLINATIVSSVMLMNAAPNVLADEVANTDMQLNIVATEDGKNASLSIKNANTATSFKLELKINGDVEYKELKFDALIEEDENSQCVVAYNEDTKVLSIEVTSDVELVKDGVLNIGTLIVEGANEAEYKITDTNGIVIVTPSSDEVKDDDLEEVGDVSIKINKVDTPPTDGEGEEEGEDTTTPPTNNDGTTNKPSTEGENTNKPSTEGENTTTPNKDVEVVQGTDGYKLVTPKTKDALDNVIREILKVDSTAKIVEIKEDTKNYTYKVRVKKVTKDTNQYDYVNIKVSKDISDKKELPGIAMDLTTQNNTTNNNTNNTTDKNDGNTEKPQTGDNSVVEILGYTSATVLSAAGLVVLNKKKKEIDEK